MSDIKVMLKEHLRDSNTLKSSTFKSKNVRGMPIKIQISKNLQNKIRKVSETPQSLSTNTTIGYCFTQEQIPVSSKMETIQSISSTSNLIDDKNTNLPHTQSEQVLPLRIVSRQLEKIDSEECEDVQDIKLGIEQKQDKFQLMLEQERKQEGSIVVKFGTQIHIQPKFMKLRGSMCSTELWSQKQKKQLCSEYLRTSQLEKKKGKELTSTFQKNGLVLSGVNSNSPFELNQIIDSRKYRMPESDKTSGVTYFKPQKMVLQADMYAHLKSQRQGVILQKQSTIEMIQNQINSKLPLDLKYRSKSGEQPYFQDQISFLANFKSSRLAQMASSIPSVNSPSATFGAATNRSDTSPYGAGSPLTSLYNSNFSTQVKLISNYSSKRNSIQKTTQQQPSQNTIVPNSESRFVKQPGQMLASQTPLKPTRKMRQPLSLQFPKDMFTSNNQNSPQNEPNTSFSSGRLNYPLTDRSTKPSMSNSTASQLTESIFSQQGNKVSRFSLKSPVYSQIKNDAIQDSSSVAKSSMSNLITKCNESLLESLQFQQEINKNKDTIQQHVEEWTKQISRKEKILFAS